MGRYNIWLVGFCAVFLLGVSLGRTTPANDNSKNLMQRESTPSTGLKDSKKTTTVPVKAPPKPQYMDLNDTTTGNHTSQSVEINVPFLAAQHRSGSGGGQQQNNMLPLMMMMMNQNTNAARQDAGAGGAGGGGGGGIDPAMMAMMMSMMQQNNNQGSG
ncbi:hypothetical protein BV898_11170 [Hypsibius exemplaris]|uniref:Uncharacterized protein n=1 Tax=Hypsibius exemplaris TaxID=2072580 RepID=A0A1W0WHI1_HYPEX|nr:hypothetical protein BV898_11170 [Hypsibius exemplaris]